MVNISQNVAKTMRLMDVWTRRAFVGGVGGAIVLSAAKAGYAIAATDSGGSPTTTHARGARIPPNLANHIRAQNHSASAVEKLLRNDREFMSAAKSRQSHMFAPPAALPSGFDWRSKNRVTPVKNQRDCGSCWVFAAIGAYESAYLIANNQDGINGDGSPSVDVSEQEPLDCGFADTDCITGGWHELVLIYLQFEGEVGDSTYPYKATKGLCTSNIQRQYHVLNWGYVDPGTNPFLIPTDQAIKQAIFRFGPIISSVSTKGWDSYSGGIFAGEPTNTLKQSDVNHEIVIVGWDDRAGVWLIRNSWDKTWGDGGYMRLKYQSNYIGFGSSWVAASPAGSMSTELTERLRATYQQNDLQKLYPAFKDLR